MRLEARGCWPGSLGKGRPQRRAGGTGAWAGGEYAVGLDFPPWAVFGFTVELMETNLIYSNHIWR